MVYTPKFILGTIGLFLAIAGWLLLNATQLPFVYGIFAPRYGRAMVAFQRMHQKEFVLSDRETGFEEISHLLKKHYIKATNVSQPEISGVKTVSWGIGIPKGAGATKWRNSITLEIIFVNHAPINGTVHDLQQLIEKEYLSVIFLWKVIVFWTGIGITFISLLMR